MSLLVTTFTTRAEYERGRETLDRFGLTYEVVSPDPGFALVGAPGVVVEEESRRALGRPGGDFFCAGWVNYRRPVFVVPVSEPEMGDESVFGRASLSVLAPCVADRSKIRIIAQLSGDVGPVLPYLNAEMDRASFSPQVPALTFMDGHRLVSLYPRRITVAKADDIVDAWRTLEAIRCRVEEVWARRAMIEPSYVTRERPPALEIFRRLPRTNCKDCHEPGCLAFAVKVWGGDASVTECRPVFAPEGTFAELRGALEEVCAALGV